MLQERAATLEAENATLHDTIANSLFKVKHLEEALAEAKRLKNKFADDNQCMDACILPGSPSLTCH